jgi:hypothetical protein
MSEWHLPPPLSPEEQHDLLVALELDYPGRVTTIFSTQTHRLVGFEIPSITILESFFLAVEIERQRRG